MILFVHLKKSNHHPRFTILFYLSVYHKQRLFKVLFILFLNLQLSYPYIYLK